MRVLLIAILTMSFASVSWSEPIQAAAPTLRERFIINAQYRGAVTQTMKNVGKGNIDYRKGQQGVFGVEIVGSLKNPETKGLWKMQVSGDFRLRGQSIECLGQKVDLSEEAKRYQKVVTDNLPFMYIARFNPLPKGADSEELTYRYEGREYVLRYVTVEDVVEATLYESGVLMGKFFLHGDYGSPPKGLVKARMVSANHIVFSLVIDRSGENVKARGD